MRVLRLHALQEEILLLQGLRPAEDPIASFPTGAIHEFITETPTSSASTSAFIAGILTSIMKNSGTTVWIGPSQKIFPPALRSFGIQPDHFLFVETKKNKDILWAMDEALKCDALSAVVAEMNDLSFTESRRLQLAVEKSRVTGFVLRTNAKKISTTACVSRWKITPAPSKPVDGMPGVGPPQWNVELLRIRNGKPGTWQLRWENGRFIDVAKDENPNFNDVPLRVNMV